MDSLKASFPGDGLPLRMLSQMAAEHISFDDYRKLCQQHGESDAAKQILWPAFCMTWASPSTTGRIPG